MYPILCQQAARLAWCVTWSVWGMLRNMLIHYDSFFLEGKRTELITMVNTIHICSAECVKGFRAMKLVLSIQEASLNITTITFILTTGSTGTFQAHQMCAPMVGKGYHSIDRNSKAALDADHSDIQLRAIWEELGMDKIQVVLGPKTTYIINK